MLDNPFTISLQEQYVNFVNAQYENYVSRFLFHQVLLFCPSLVIVLINSTLEPWFLCIYVIFAPFLSWTAVFLFFISFHIPSPFALTKIDDFNTLLHMIGTIMLNIVTPTQDKFYFYVI